MADNGKTRAASSGRKRGAGWELAAWLAAAGILVVFRLHAYSLPLETDECNYAYIADRMLAGDRLYVDAWDHQPPGVYMLFAGAIILFGDSPGVFRTLALCFSIISLTLLWLIARREAGRGWATVAGLLFALASSDPGTAGEGCNREIYMNTLLLAAWWCVDPRRAHAPPRLLAAGALLAIASALKTIVAVHWAALVVGVLLCSWPTKPRASQLTRTLACLAAGPAVLWAATAGYFALTSRWSLFVDAVFRFNLGYAEGVVPFWPRFWIFANPPRHPFVFESALPLWIGGAVALVALVAGSLAQRRPRMMFIPIYLAASYAAVCLPGHFWPHYYHLMIPPLVLVIVISLAELGGRTDPSRAANPRGLLAIPACAIIAWLAWTQSVHYLRQPPFGITITRYNSRDFWGRAMGEKLARVTDPDDTIFVYGNEAEMYYYSGRRCASRFTMISGIAEGARGADDRRRILLDDLRDHRPRVILLLFDEPPFPEWRAFLEANYSEPVGWDLHDRTGEAILYVLEDPLRPIERIDWNWDRAEAGGWFLGERR